MKTFIFVVLVVLLMNMVPPKIYHTFGLEQQSFRQKTLADYLASKQEKAKENISKGCCFPTSFQGATETYQPGLSFPIQQQFFVDSANSRIATIFGQMRQVLSCSCCVCTLASMIDSRKYCERHVLFNVSFDDVYEGCIPQRATKLGTVRIGPASQQSSMNVQQWAFSASSTIRIRRLVTANGCFPVANIVTSTTGSCQSELINTYFFNVSSPVRDTRVFAIPPYCRRRAEEEEEESARNEKPDMTSFNYLLFK